MAQGGNTNKGGPSTNFALLPEYALSAAILSIDLDAIGSTTYDLPTLDDPSRSGSPADVNDPFGGNDGAEPGAPHPRRARCRCTLPASATRTTSSSPSRACTRSTTAATRAGAGCRWEKGPGGTCTNAQSEPGVSDRDALHRVTPGYYGGHPNPVRGNKLNVFGGVSPVDPAVAANPVECDFRSPGTRGAGNAAGALVTFPTSTNGLAEYTATNFGGAMEGTWSRRASTTPSTASS